jgi:hypothetical protein
MDGYVEAYGNICVEGLWCRKASCCACTIAVVLVPEVRFGEDITEEERYGWHRAQSLLLQNVYSRRVVVVLAWNVDSCSIHQYDTHHRCMKAHYHHPPYIFI